MHESRASVLLLHIEQGASAPLPAGGQGGDRVDMERFFGELERHEPGLLGYEKARKTAVLVTLQQDTSGVWHVLFERRAMTLRRQPGEISFPGGHVEDDDANYSATAVRETSEELGIPIDRIRVVGALDVFAASSSLLVYPFVGVLPQGYELQPNPHEVDEVIKVSLGTLMEHRPSTYTIGLAPVFPEDFPFHLIPGGKDYSWRTSTQTQYFYTVHGHVIWGLTARILTHFLSLARP